MCVIVDKMYHLGVWLPLWSPNAAQPPINQTATITVTDGLCNCAGYNCTSGTSAYSDHR